MTLEEQFKNAIVSFKKHKKEIKLVPSKRLYTDFLTESTCVSNSDIVGIFYRTLNKLFHAKQF